MKVKRTRLRAAVSTEVAVGIALAAIVVVVAIALFNDNLSQMITNTNLVNMFNGNGDKTSFSSFNRDYKDSQINVQIMGEQGLSMLRRKANNKALELIDQGASQNSSGIAYLATAIKAITGEPHICKYMKENSDEHCDDPSIGGYEQKVSILSKTLLLTDVDTSKVSVYPTINPNVAAVISANPVSVDLNTGKSKLDKNQKFEFIVKLTDEVSAYLSSDVLLLAPSKTFRTAVADSTGEQTNGPIGSNSVLSVSDLKTSLVTLLDNLNTSLKNEHDNCKSMFGDFAAVITPEGCTPPDEHGLESGSNTGYVDKSELANFATYVSTVQGSIRAYSGTSSTAAINTLLNSANINNMIKIMKNDHYNDPYTCNAFRDGIKDLANRSNASVVIPECVPNDLDLDDD